MNRKFVSGEVRKLYSAFSREYSTVVITIFCIVCFEEVARGFDDPSNNRLKYANVSGIRLPFNYNF